MRSHNGYRALIVFATVLVHMHGTLAERIAGSASKRNGESSSLLWFSRASSHLALPCLTLPPPLLSFSSAFATYARYCSSSAANRPLPPDGYARASFAASPSSFTTYFFLFLLLLRLLRESNMSSLSRSSSLSLISLYLCFSQGIRCTFIYFIFAFFLSFTFSLCPLFFLKGCYT